VVFKAAGVDVSASLGGVANVYDFENHLIQQAA
jgi:hypothetical protein